MLLYCIEERIILKNMYAYDNFNKNFIKNYFRMSYNMCI